MNQVVKVNPNPLGGKFTPDVHNQVIKNIENIKGVRKFRVNESPFIKPEKINNPPTNILVM
jgi:hypothetical protein